MSFERSERSISYGEVAAYVQSCLESGKSHSSIRQLLERMKLPRQMIESVLRSAQPDINVLTPELEIEEPTPPKPDLSRPAEERQWDANLIADEILLELEPNSEAPRRPAREGFTRLVLMEKPVELERPVILKRRERRSRGPQPKRRRSDRRGSASSACFWALVGAVVFHLAYPVLHNWFY